jgi:hypothetical protein
MTYAKSPIVNRGIIILAIALIVVCFVGCSKKHEPTSPSTGAAGIAMPGRWCGGTDQGLGELLAVSFSVEIAEEDSVVVDGLVMPISCDNSLWWLSLAGEICVDSCGGFLLDCCPWGDGYYSLCGEFTSATSCAGTFSWRNITINGCATGELQWDAALCD